MEVSDEFLRLKIEQECMREDMKNNVKKVKIDSSSELHLIDFSAYSEDFIKDFESHLSSICVGKLGKKLSLIKLRLREFLYSKDDNTRSGAIAELFIAYYLKNAGYKQEYLFFNLEEGSIKKGFDGVFSMKKKSYLMESKSTLPSTKNKSHRSKINEAYTDLKNYVEGRSKKGKNNPWRNAYNHASHCDVKTSQSIKKKLDKLADKFDERKYIKVRLVNIIPCSTIFGLTKDACPNQVAEDDYDYIKNLEANSKVILCIKSRNINDFISYLEN